MSMTMTLESPRGYAGSAWNQRLRLRVGLGAREEEGGLGAAVESGRSPAPRFKTRLGVALGPLAATEEDPGNYQESRGVLPATPEVLTVRVKRALGARRRPAGALRG